MFSIDQIPRHSYLRKMIDYRNGDSSGKMRKNRMTEKEVIPKPDPIVIEDENNEAITINQDSSRYYSRVEITWRSQKTKLNSFSKPLQREDIGTIENFRIGRLIGVRLSIQDEVIELVDEEVDQRTVKDKFGDDVKFTISGPRGSRILSATWFISDNYTKTTTCGVGDDTTTADLEYIKVLCEPQDHPHGILVKIRGMEVEIDNRQESERPTFTYLQHLWAEIQHQTELENDFDVAMTCSENIRLIKILKGRDLLELTQQLDHSQLELTKEKAELENAKLLIEQQTRKIEELERLLNSTTSQLGVLTDERKEYKSMVMNKLRETLNSV